MEGSRGLLERERERSFIENGSKLLEELITSCKDKRRCNPIRNFSAEQVIEATNYFQSHGIDDYNSQWNKGTLDNRPVLIKKYNRGIRNIGNGSCRDIEISS
ncbi:hypothetical protein PanWU01x14_102120 [Parasponia andersonii]|uniref:Uncharacterized protein n=1 Tax=Parasponia andersonii TaxID=3476 RepID=A0A2P5D2W8_PARAD|nr:hypothetical protein PanWU01x14_102120 [Parasponia andersonii]